jgi:flagellar hook assembly protein FlgD
MQRIIGGAIRQVSDYVDFNPWLFWPGIEEYTISPPVTLNLQVTPNPFSKLTTISFSKGQSAERMAIQIYDAAGRLVKNLYSAMPHAPCAMQISWDGTDQNNRQLGSGVYFVRLSCGDRTDSQKILLVR